METRTGVYICHCGLNIAATVNPGEVAQYAASLRGVAVARDYIFMCSDPGQALKDGATEKAKALMRAAVMRVYHQQPLKAMEVPINPNTLVVGGGIAGVQA